MANFFLPVSSQIFSFTMDAGNGPALSNENFVDVTAANSLATWTMAEKQLLNANGEKKAGKQLLESCYSFPKQRKRTNSTSDMASSDESLSSVFGLRVMRMSQWAVVDAYRQRSLLSAKRCPSLIPSWIRSPNFDWSIRTHSANEFSWILMKWTIDGSEVNEWIK